MIAFLNDIYHGRVTHEHDNFPYMFTKGKLVVDYFIACMNKLVITNQWIMKQIIDNFKLSGCISDVKHIPDHGGASKKAFL